MGKPGLQSRPSIPRPCYAKVRLVKGGPQVACRLTMERPRDPVTNEVLDRSFRLVPYIQNRRIDGVKMDDWIHRIWMFGEFISREDHQKMVEYALWCERHRPDAPEANIFKPVLRRMRDARARPQQPARDDRPETGWPDG